MRHVAVLLLLLLTPGLLLPAGLRLHVCRCAPLPTPARSCCHAPVAAPAPSCCHRTPAAPDRAPGAVQDDCGCQWLPLPARDSDSGEPELGLPQAPPALPALAAVVLPRPHWATDAGPSSPIAPRAPPPPGEHRNLPLRL